MEKTFIIAMGDLFGNCRPSEHEKVEMGCVLRKCHSDSLFAEKYRVLFVFKSKTLIQNESKQNVCNVIYSSCHRCSREKAERNPFQILNKKLQHTLKV